MDLKTYIDGDRGRASTLAGALRVSRSYLSQMASGRAAISPERCVEIEQLTAGAVTRKELRGDWDKIWPELRTGQPGGRRRDDPPVPPAPQAAGATSLRG